MIEYPHPYGFADLTYINGSDVQVGEIKPSSWDLNPAKKKIGKTQLLKEILGVSKRVYPIVAKPMTIWKPNFIINVPASGLNLAVYTNPGDPGMVYYCYNDLSRELNWKAMAVALRVTLGIYRKMKQMRDDILDDLNHLQPPRDQQAPGCLGPAGVWVRMLPLVGAAI